MNIYRIYFAHPATSHNTDGEKRITEILKERGWQVINPFLDDAHQKAEFVNNIRQNRFGILDSAKLVLNDIIHIGRSDAILVWLPKGHTSVGTICELIHGWYMGKYIIIIYELHDFPHPWAWWHSDEFYRSIDDFENRRVCSDDWWKEVEHDNNDS